MNHQRDNPVHQLKEFRKITLFHGEDSASLVTYYPDFLGLMNKYPEARLILITLRESAELARSLGVFDEVLVISQRSKIRYYLTWVYSLFKMVNSDLFIALDLTSRYSWVRFFSKFPFSRRTIRAEAAAKDRRNISFETADRLIREAGAEVALSSECFRHFRQVHNVPVLRFLQYRLGVGHSCPGSLKERMMSASTWAYLIQARLRECDSWTRSQVEVMFFGAASDYERAQDIIGLCTDDYPEVKFKNHCGKYTLNQTIRILSTLDEYWGVDNWLLQLSRLLRVRSVSFWGPTSPQERLRPIPDYQDQIQWMQLPCSPCVGKTEQPPCQGQNNCMWFDLAADKSSRTEPSFKWVSASRG